jgi:hypothetical protein
MKKTIPTITNLTIFGLIFYALPTAVQARSTTFVEPDPVGISCELSSKQMQRSITTGGRLRHWKVVEKSDGNIHLRYIKGNNKHIITVNVSYTPNSFAVTYLDSVNLNYKVQDDGSKRIHPRPVGWMKNLSGDIEQFANDNCES